jgi:hypothetical protein
MPLDWAMTQNYLGGALQMPSNFAFDVRRSESPPT